MSIATLKKKSKQFKLGEGISGRGKNGFSLNGGLRNQGWVGQGVRGRHLSRTIYRGLTPVGNGGCCGTYPEHILSQPNCSVNDPNIIKRSAMNTPGYIAATVVNPTSVFNSDCSGNCQKKWVSVYTQIPDYSIYIAEKAQAAMFCDNVVINGSGSQLTCYTDRYIDDTYSSTTIQTINLGIPNQVINTTLVPPEPPPRTRLLFLDLNPAVVTEVLNITFTSNIAWVEDDGGTYNIPLDFTDGNPVVDSALTTVDAKIADGTVPLGPLPGVVGETWFLKYSTVVAGGGRKFIPGCKASRRIGGKKRPLTPYFKDMRGAQDASWWNENRVYYINCLPPPLCKAPWPTTASRKCKINYLTPEEAVAAGALPPDWMNCLPGTRPGLGFKSYTNNAFSSY